MQPVRHRARNQFVIGKAARLPLEPLLQRQRIHDLAPQSFLSPSQPAAPSKVGKHRQRRLPRQLLGHTLAFAQFLPKQAVRGAVVRASPDHSLHDVEHTLIHAVSMRQDAPRAEAKSAGAPGGGLLRWAGHRGASPGERLAFPSSQCGLQPPMDANERQ